MTRATRLVAARELFSFLSAPSTWLTVGAAWLLLGFFFCDAILPGTRGDLRDVVVGLSDAWWWVQLFLAPLLCMRLLSEEKRTGTFETLMTAPVGDHEVVVGKFLAAAGVLAFAGLGAPALVATTACFGGRPDLGQLLSSYLGAVGVGSVLCAVGVFASATTTSQIFAAFLSTAINLTLAAAPWVAARELPADHVVARALSRGSMPGQLREAASGIVDANNVAFQIVASALFLLFAIRTLEARKWR
jgi:ABC-2 type transport system permease protein